jgi:hypothetical protein
VIVGGGVVVCGNILGNAMYSTSKTIVAAVNIPILKINNFTFM